MSTLLALCVFALQDPRPVRQPLVPAPEAQAASALPDAAAGLPQDARRATVPEAPPFDRDRPLLRVAEGVTIDAVELNELVAYYRSWRGGGEAMLLRAAVDALLPSKAVEAAYGGELEGMRARIDEALAKLRDGADFAAVVQEYSDDTEAPTADARYTFTRGVAVQPFDRHAHTAATGVLVGPFLTKYGYHVLQVLGYERDADEPREDATTVRHLLVMYPSLKALDDAEVDIRAHIRELVAATKPEVLEPGLENLLPPTHRRGAPSAAPAAAEPAADAPGEGG